jgi:outer membrane protein assembly factor BamE (lipoprotein component of BamABCDE complex)
LELGREVEYSLTTSRNCITGGNYISAENVRLLPRGENRDDEKENRILLTIFLFF